jgi:hypothetical protein
MEAGQIKGASSRIEDISTDWAIVRDPGCFVHHYGCAIQRYLGALLSNPFDAEEVAQEFFLRVSQHGFIRTREVGGRFRDYLKAAVRNAALSFVRRRRSLKPTNFGILQATIPDGRQLAADQIWIAEYRLCLLDRACRALEKHEDSCQGNLFHTVLTMVVDNPLDDTNTLATRTSALIGRPVRAEAFRKQISRARRKLARLIVQEVAETLDSPTSEQIREELIELALWEYVRDFVALGCSTSCQSTTWRCVH